MDFKINHMFCNVNICFSIKSHFKYVNDNLNYNFSYWNYIISLSRQGRNCITMYKGDVKCQCPKTTSTKTMLHSLIWLCFLGLRFVMFWIKSTLYTPPSSLFSLSWLDLVFFFGQIFHVVRLAMTCVQFSYGSKRYSI